MKEKVSLIRCNDYNFDKVKSSIIDSFHNLGGIEKYIDKGETVLLKLNLLMMKKPEDATTTHPVFTKALAQVLIEYGARVIIGDSPGGPFNNTLLKRIYKTCGIEKVAEEVGAELNYNTNSMEIANDKGLILKRITAIEVLQEVDKVISVSKLKTHGMMTFTGAVKNMFGVIPGLEKAEYHVRFKDYESFSNALVDICLAVTPTLSFMDGIVGMEGAGPSAGDTRKVGAVIASTSPYHLDVVATSIIGLKSSKVPTIQRCIERNLCKGNLEDIELLGDSLEGFILNDFVVPETRSLDLLDGILPKFVSNLFNNLIQPKPVFNHDKCVGCSDCAESCPPGVIDMIENRPHVSLEGCIRCFCCQELCPAEAVDIHRPILMKLLSKM
ncbi:DUF362 domain-containing protein [Sporosalibacterium faouarense]|uniref:DUF362 domain-containing protein n=1 Tax=Sporosalibacterium faouarense TaxID=516123 RepID=UPI00141C6952|nr:DUF362 domain-containing protein [Sporosalibacterium faouarense]MTI49261.1 DUF362 domain-containing protein [Bacillota bacterium]